MYLPILASMRSRSLLPYVVVALVAGLLGGIAGAALYGAVLDSDDGRGERGSVLQLSARQYHGIEDAPFCVDLQHFCLVQLESGEIRALYTYDTHQWSRNRSCEIAWLPDMSFRDPATDEESIGWFRAGCSGTTYRYNGELVFGPGPRDMDEFPVEYKTERVTTSDGEPFDIEYIEVDTRRLICGEAGNPSVPPGCERAPAPQ